jgi:hypothetical protein
MSIEFDYFGYDEQSEIRNGLKLRRDHVSNVLRFLLNQKPQSAEPRRLIIVNKKRLKTVNNLLKRFT